MSFIINYSFEQAKLRSGGRRAQGPERGGRYGHNGVSLFAVFFTRAHRTPKKMLAFSRERAILRMILITRLKRVNESSLFVFRIGKLGKEVRA